MQVRSQVRTLIAVALLGATAVASMAQELDPAHDRVFTSQRSRESVKAEARNLQAQGALKAVGETAAAPVVDAVPTATAKVADEHGLTRAQVKAELAKSRSSRVVRVGEFG